MEGVWWHVKSDCALWDCQMLLRNWVVIKVVFGCMMKHGMGCEWIKMEFAPPR
jgi:hypothetical protein